MQGKHRQLMVIRMGRGAKLSYRRVFLFLLCDFLEPVDCTANESRSEVPEALEPVNLLERRSHRQGVGVPGVNARNKWVYHPFKRFLAKVASHKLPYGLLLRLVVVVVGGGGGEELRGVRELKIK